MNQSTNTEINSNKFILRMKNIGENNYSENLVLTEDGLLKYRKSDDRPNFFYSLNLIDIALSEKYQEDKKRFKIIASSISKSFSDKIFKHKDQKYLNLFKISLEKAIIKQKNIKNNKQEIIVKISKEEKSHINIRNSNISDIEVNKLKSSRVYRQYNKNLNQSNQKNSFYNLVTNLKDFQIESKKFDEIFKSEYKFYKNKKDIIIATNNIEGLAHKLNEDMFHNYSNENSCLEDFEKFFKTQITKNLKFHSIIQKILFIAIILLTILNLYKNKFPNVLFSLFIFYFLKSNFFSSTLNNKIYISTSKETMNPNNLYVMSEFNLNFDIINIHNLITNTNYLTKWNKNLLKVEYNKNEGFSLRFQKGKRDFEFSKVEFKSYHNVNENMIYVIQSLHQEEKQKELNIFQLKSNDKFTKTKVTMFSIIDREYPVFYVESVSKTLSRFRKFIIHELGNVCNFMIPNGINSPSEYQEIIKLLKNNSINLNCKKSNLENEEKASSEINKNTIIVEKTIETTQEYSYKTELNIENNFSNYEQIQKGGSIKERDSPQLISLDESKIQEVPSVSKISERNINSEFRAMALVPCYVSQTNYLKINSESFQKFKEESERIIHIINSDLKQHLLTDELLIDILTQKNYISFNDNKTSTDNSNILFIKQYHMKPNNRKIYKAKIKIDFSVDIVLTYLKKIENKFKFNKYLKDSVVLFSNEKIQIEYQLFDFKLFSKIRDFVIFNDNRVINLKERKIQIISSHSIPNEIAIFSKIIENTERGFIKSSGYYIEELGAPNTCKLGFWIDCEISHDLNLEDNVLKNYLNHLIEIRENLIFDYVC